MLSDGTRNLHMYYVHPLDHVEGMLMAYLPTEQIVIEADLFDTHAPLPTTATVANKSFLTVVQQLKLDVAQIAPIHGNPLPWAEFLKVMGQAQ